MALIKKANTNESKHAITIIGIQKDQSLKLTHLQIADPNQPQAQWLTIEAFQAMHQDQHFLVFFRLAEQFDRQFRKTALILKANEHRTPNFQKQSLLKQALSYDPSDGLLKQQILKITP